MVLQIRVGGQRSLAQQLAPLFQGIEFLAQRRAEKRRNELTEALRDIQQQRVEQSERRLELTEEETARARDLEEQQETARDVLSGFESPEARAAAAENLARRGLIPQSVAQREQTERERRVLQQGLRGAETPEEVENAVAQVDPFAASQLRARRLLREQELAARDEDTAQDRFDDRALLQRISALDESLSFFQGVEPGDDLFPQKQAMIQRRQQLVEALSSDRLRNALTIPEPQEPVGTPEAPEEPAGPAGPGFTESLRQFGEDIFGNSGASGPLSDAEQEEFDRLREKQESAGFGGLTDEEQTKLINLATRRR